jgi:hypothetical protein
MRIAGTDTTLLTLYVTVGVVDRVGQLIKHSCITVH